MTVLRYTWRQLTEDATAVIVEVAQALARAATSAGRAAD
jgi:hypothetical protein